MPSRLSPLRRPFASEMRLETNLIDGFSARNRAAPVTLGDGLQGSLALRACQKPQAGAT
jgi:hypothetical protein